ncbi:MAG TPA: hypothetical protein VF691_21740 [Cytophagaceae bacterium]|jgi:hypothetical protein
MTKGHNKGSNNGNTDNGKGQDGHLKSSKKDHSPNQGRQKDKDPSGGTKGGNSI